MSFNDAKQFLERVFVKAGHHLIFDEHVGHPGRFFSVDTCDSEYIGGATWFLDIDRLEINSPLLEKFFR